MSDEMLAIAPPDRGLLLVVTGPSGVGKSTLIKRALRRVPGLAFSASATTRKPRAGEVDGVDYRFLDQTAFDGLVAEGAFLEFAQVYDRSYGTLRAPTERAMAAGRSIVLDIDVQGAKQVRDSLPEAVHIFIAPPDIPTLEARLRARNTDDEATICRRMTQVSFQLRGIGAYDYVVVNDDLTVAQTVFEAILLAEMARVSRRVSVVQAFVGSAG